MAIKIFSPYKRAGSRWTWVMEGYKDSKGNWVYKHTHTEALGISNVIAQFSYDNNKEEILKAFTGIAWNQQEIPENAIIKSTEILLRQVNPESDSGVYGGYVEHSGNIRIAYKTMKFVPGYEFKFDDITNYITARVRKNNEGYTSLRFDGDLDGTVVLNSLEPVYLNVSEDSKDKLGVNWRGNKGAFQIFFPGIRLQFMSDDITIKIEYELPPPPKPGNLFPDGDTLNPRGDVRFSWTKEDEQEYIHLQYSINQGNTWTTLINQRTRNNFYIASGGTIEHKHTGRVDWRIKIGNEEQIYSDWSTATFTAGVEEPQSPYLVRPVGDYIKEHETVRLEWIYRGDISTYQTSVEYSLSEDNGKTWTTRQQHLMEDRYYLDLVYWYFRPGTVLWKIRTLNDYKEWSPWSDIAQFTIIGAPSPPWFKEITNNNRPTIKWVANNQDIYRIWIKDKGENLIYDTDEVADANARELKLPIFLKSGKEYTFYIQTKNNFNIESLICEYRIILSPILPTKPEIDVYSQDYRVVITGSIVDGLIYRDGKYIGKLAEGEFLDYTAGNKIIHEYFVRNVENDNYNDSEIKQGQCNFRKNTIATIDNFEDFIEVYVNLDNFPQKSFDFRLDFKNMNFAGRTYKATEFGESIQDDRSFSFYVEEKEPILKLIKQKKELIYRDVNGEVIYGTITSISGEKRLDGYTVVFTVGRTRE